MPHTAAHKRTGRAARPRIAYRRPNAAAHLAQRPGSQSPSSKAPRRPAYSCSMPPCSASDIGTLASSQSNRISRLRPPRWHRITSTRPMPLACKKRSRLAPRKAELRPFRPFLGYIGPLWRIIGAFSAISGSFRPIMALLGLFWAYFGPFRPVLTHKWGSFRPFWSLPVGRARLARLGRRHDAELDERLACGFLFGLFLRPAPGTGEVHPVDHYGDLEALIVVRALFVQ